MQRNTVHFAELLQQRLELLEQLRELTYRQVELIDSSDLNELLSVLSRKQMLLDQFHHLNAELSIYKDEDPDRRLWETEELRSKSKAAADRAQALVAEMLRMEQGSMDRMSERRDMVAAQLQHIASAEVAHAAYSQTGIGIANQLDLSCEG